MSPIVIITTIFIIVLIFLAARQMKLLKAKAKQCAKEAEQFHERLKQLSDPSHLFTDKEVHQLKREYDPLLRTVNQLYDSPFISNEYLDSLGLGNFMDERKLVNHMQYKNNQTYNENDQQ